MFGDILLQNGSDTVDNEELKGENGELMIKASESFSANIISVNSFGLAL